jgi:hypothetical protein
VVRLTEEQKHVIEAALKIKWDDDPTLGGVVGTCRGCGTSDHEGRICKRVRAVEFYKTTGELKTIRFRGEKQTKEESYVGPLD